MDSKKKKKAAASSSSRKTAAKKTAAKRVALSDAEAERIYRDRLKDIETLLKAGKTYRQVIDELQLPLTEDQCDAIGRKRTALVLYSNGYGAEDIAEELGIDEETGEDILVAEEDRLLSMYANGSSYEEIANRENLTSQQVVNVIKGKIERANTLQGISMQSYTKAKSLDKKGRVDLLSAVRDILLKEIKERGLSEVSADKLVSLLLKTNEQIRAELEKTPTIILSDLEQTRKESIRSLGY